MTIHKKPASGTSLSLLAVTAVLLPTILAAALSGGSPTHAGEAPAFEENEVEGTLPDRTIHIDCLKPAVPKASNLLVLYATGDAGWMGVSRPAFEHIGELGFYVAGYNSKELLKPTKSSGKKETIEHATDLLLAAVREAKAAFGMPETTPAILAGF